MKKLFALLLASILCVSLGAASADWTDAWAEDFPDWTVDVHTSAYPGEEGRNLYEIMMTRVEDGALWIRSVRFELPEGQETVPDDAEWVVYPPIPVSEAAAERLSALKPYAFIAGPVDVSAIRIKDEYLPGVAVNLLRAGEALESLMIRDDMLAAVALDAEGGHSLRVSLAEGQTWGEPVMSPPQQTGIDINEYQSGGGDHPCLEVGVGLEDFYEINFAVDDQGVWVLCEVQCAEGVSYQLTGRCVIDYDFLEWPFTNAARHYGFPGDWIRLDEIDFRSLPTSSELAAALLETDGFACTARDGVPICDAPDGEVIAELYARCVGVELERQNGWVLVQIGDPECAFAGWIREEDLAFGADIGNVPCGFPDYVPTGGDPERLYMSSRTELPLYSLESRDAEPVDTVMYTDPLYLIGRMPDGRYLVLLNDQMLYAIPAELIEIIGAEA